MSDETCAHCGQSARGFGIVDGVRLCHTGTLPVDADPQDCYRQVLIYQHRADGSCCNGLRIEA